jgi:hypothetical protein
MNPMRTKFQDQLDALTDRLASMCHLAEQAIEVATDALVRADLPAAERVFDLNEQIEAWLLTWMGKCCPTAGLADTGVAPPPGRTMKNLPSTTLTSPTATEVAVPGDSAATRRICALTARLEVRPRRVDVSGHAACARGPGMIEGQ